MADMNALRKGVRKSLSPEIDGIKDKALRDKVVEAYALALSETKIKSLDDMRCSGMIGLFHIPGMTQADHLRGVGRISKALAVELKGMFNKELKIDPDFALAAGLLHDVGKPYFYDADHIEHWDKNSAYTGQPPFRHTFYGAHLALKAGLPVEIAHVIAGHDIRMEGQYFTHSVYLKIVAHADAIYWEVPGRLGMVEKDPAKVNGPMA